MESLNLPTYSFRIKNTQGKNYIFDELRRRFVVLTPEEWVRQHIVKFLTIEKAYPVQLISIEKGYRHNRLSRRYDLLVYDRKGLPVMIVECKAPAVGIAQKIFDQATRYNEQYNARYLLVTNGLKHFCCRLDMKNKKYSFLKEIPQFGDLI